MGIYDRDYIRQQPRPTGGATFRGLAGLRMWSVTTWLIVICVAVFVIDGFTRKDLVQIGGPYRAVGVDGIPAGYVQVGPDQVISDQFIHEADRPYAPSQFWAVPIGAPNVPRVFGWLHVAEMGQLTKWLHFSTARGIITFQSGGNIVGFEFWRLIGFQVLHASPAHLLFNMIGLFFFGPIVESALGRKRYLAFYLLSGIFGALMYLLLNVGGFVATRIAGESVTIPGLLFNDPQTPLVGASAGVFGVLMAGAYLAPNIVVYLFLVIPMRLQILAYGLVALALYTVIRGGANAGGEAGHLGGAIAGWYFIRHPHHLHGFFDILGRVDPTSHHYRGRGGAGRRDGPIGARTEAEIDRILLKIKEQGMDSLTAKERRLLQDASRGG